MKKILLACLFVLSGTMAFAQFSGSKSGSATTTNGWSSLRVSYGFNTLKGERSERKYSNSASMNSSELTASWVKGFALTSSVPVFMEVGPEVSWITGKDDNFGEEMDGFQKYNQVSVNVPINVGYLVQATEDISIYPYVGLKPKFNLVESGTEEYYNHKYDYYGSYNGEVKKEKTYNLFDKDDYGAGDDAFGNRLQLGMQVGCGVNIQKFHVGLSYNFDLTDAASAKEGDWSASLNNSSVRLTVGYNF